MTPTSNPFEYMTDRADDSAQSPRSPVTDEKTSTMSWTAFIASPLSITTLEWCSAHLPFTKCVPCRKTGLNCGLSFFRWHFPRKVLGMVGTGTPGRCYHLLFTFVFSEGCVHASPYKGLTMYLQQPMFSQNILVCTFLHKEILLRKKLRDICGGRTRYSLKYIFNFIL